MPAAGSQAFRRKAYCKIIVAGRDVTSLMDPHLLSVEVIDRLDEYDEASIELDDRDASLAIPPPRSPVQISLGWESEGSILVFDGFIVQVESGFNRAQGGRRMWIEAKSGIMTGPERDNQLRSFGQGDAPQ